MTITYKSPLKKKQGVYCVSDGNWDTSVKKLSGNGFNDGKKHSGWTRINNGVVKNSPDCPCKKYKEVSAPA